MSRITGLLLVAMTVESGDLRAQTPRGNGVDIVFAAVEQGQQVLGSRDDFVARMSPFDRAARMKTDQTVAEKDYLEFAARHVRKWSAAEKKTIALALQGVLTGAMKLKAPLPDRVLLVKTSGDEEGGAAYTRANAIVLPQAVLKESARAIQQKLGHELFHIISRANPQLRERLYETIGFVKCHEVAMPQELQSRKITNPDAPRNDHCIRLQVDGKQRWVVPILFSSEETYDVRRGGEFVDYLQFLFLVGEFEKTSALFTPFAEGATAQLAGLRQLAGFFEQVGENTHYVIHPEEILAENFAMLIMGQRDVPSPQILDKLETVLKGESAGDE